MRLLVSVGVTLLAAAGLFAVGFMAGQDRAKATEAAQERRLQELAAKVAGQTAEAISAIRVVNQTVSGRVREVIRENTVYRECLVDPVLQRVLNDARQGRAEPSAAGGGLPAAGTSPAP